MIGVDASATDEECWRAALAGDRAAFGAVFERHADRVLTHCSRRLGSRVDGEDATSQVFMVAWNKAESIRFVDGSALPWLLVVATHVTHKMRRRMKVESRYALPTEDSGPGGESDDIADEVARRVDGERTASILAAAVGSLGRHHRDVVSLCDLGELGLVEAAAVLGVPVGTVKSRLSRAHAKLRADLGFLNSPTAASEISWPAGPNTEEARR